MGGTRFDRGVALFADRLTYNGKTEKFDNQVMDVAVSSDYIFVVNRSSRIDLFRRNDYSYVTTIGVPMAVEFSVAMRSGRSGR